jgi:hypothetical protein
VRACALSLARAHSAWLRARLLLAVGYMYDVARSKLLLSAASVDGDFSVCSHREDILVRGVLFVPMCWWCSVLLLLGVAGGLVLLVLVFVVWCGVGVVLFEVGVGHTATRNGHGLELGILAPIIPPR